MHQSAKEQQLEGYQDSLWSGSVACLTAQLNFTYYPSIEEIRWVATSREPIANHELSRAGGQSHHSEAWPALTEEVKAMGWLVRYHAEVANRPH